MKLIIYNGSPRGAGSNTTILLDRFISGFLSSGNNQHELFYLKKVEPAECVKAVQSAEYVLLAFPLYTDSMPGIVKQFIESLSPLRGKGNRIKMGFIVQSGFPEGIHCSYIGHYFDKLCRRLSCEYLGTVTKGGVEGIKTKTEKQNKKLLTAFEDLGKVFGKTGSFDKSIATRLRSPMTFPAWVLILVRLFNALGLTSVKWNKELKKNHAYEKRFARPYDQ
jgi:multimeric flavodoxin WrbA